MGLPPRLVAARWLLHRWPLRRGRQRAAALLLAGFHCWPARADFDFRFGRFLDASLDQWPRGFRELFLHGTMERDELAVWRVALRPGDVVIDGGANWGYWSLVAASLVGPHGQVYAFEPLPRTAAALRRNVAASGREVVVRVLECALGAHPGTMDLYVYDDDPFLGGTSAGVQPGRPVAGRVRVNVQALDQLLPDGAPPVLVKLDVEGSELAALKGAHALRRGTPPPVICLEWNKEAARPLGYHPVELLELLAGDGYAFFLAERGRLRPFTVPPAADGWIPMVWCVPRNGRWRDRLAPLLPDGN